MRRMTVWVREALASTAARPFATARRPVAAAGLLLAMAAVAVAAVPNEPIAAPLSKPAAVSPADVPSSEVAATDVAVLPNRPIDPPAAKPAAAIAADATPIAGVKPKAEPKLSSEGVAFFESKIRPVLVESCYSCHSAGEGAKVKGDLRVDTRDALRKGGSGGKPGVVPGDVEASAIIQAIRYTDQDLLMPPKKRLSAAVVKDFETWVKMGAPDPRTDQPAGDVAGGKNAKNATGAGSGASAGPDAASAAHAYKAPAPESAEAKGHWSFKPVQSPTPPAVKDTGWAKNDVDKFVLAKLEERGLRPVAQADRRTLIRRATFDLTGLPPTPEEVDAFASDQSPDAFAKVVDRLLASPAYGERWGRHWLDVARYADTAGESADFPVPQAHKYRDYVIGAFNADKPYDQFVREQIAGDLLPAKDEEARKQQVVATGFVATARRFSVRPEREMHLTVDDTLDTMGKAVLGLSLSCARCHDHKFDPIPSADYYALYGIFASSQYPMPGCEELQFQKDFVPLLSKDEYAKTVQPYREKLATLEAEASQAKDDAWKGRATKEVEALRKRADETKKAAEKLAAAAPQVDDAYAIVDGKEGVDAYVQLRGEPSNHGPTVRRGFPAVLGGQKLPDGYKGSGRLELATWLTDPANPLTARVMVNRVWQHHFGRGLVATPNDFGFRGAAPTHPELLDYLATQFVKDGWSVKALHRRVLLSATYQTGGGGDAGSGDASVAESNNVTIDPTNELLWRFERRRLDAEQIRDAMLAVSGKLESVPMEAGHPDAGDHPFPTKDKWKWSQHNPFQAAYETNRRSVYLMVQRIRRHPFLATFDGADPNASTGDRLVSTTPLQALFMMNDPLVFASAEGLAARANAAVTADGKAFEGRRSAADVDGNGGISGTAAATVTGDAARVDRAYRLAFGRSPSAGEAAAAASYLREFKAKAVADKVATDGAAADQAALVSLCRVLLASNEFLFVE